MTFQRVEGEPRMVEAETGWELDKVQTFGVRAPCYQLVLRLGGVNQIIFDATKREKAEGYNVAWYVNMVSVVGDACKTHEEVEALLKRVLTDFGYDLGYKYKSNPHPSVKIEVEDIHFN